jgi:hypothetical protein
MAVDVDELSRRVCDGEGDADFVKAFCAKLEAAGNIAFACWVLVSWANNTACEDHAWAYKKAYDFYTILGNRGAAALAMRKARRGMISLVSSND